MIKNRTRVTGRGTSMSKTRRQTAQHMKELMRLTVAGSQVVRCGGNVRLEREARTNEAGL